MNQFQQFALDLGLSRGELLQLAREAAQDCALTSVDHLTEAEADEILYQMSLIYASEPVAA